MSKCKRCGVSVPEDHYECTKGHCIRLIEVSTEDAFEGTRGVCLRCGEIATSGVEPDARDYECENCGAHRVFGIETAAIEGRLVLDE